MLQNWQIAVLVYGTWPKTKKRQILTWVQHSSDCDGTLCRNGTGNLKIRHKANQLELQIGIWNAVVVNPAQGYLLVFRDKHKEQSTNRLSSTASYQALIGQIESPTCPHCGSGDETAERLLLLCPKLAAERQRYFGDSIDITDVFHDYQSPVEFLISSGHLSPL